MKIYLAASAPGTEGGPDRPVCEQITKRLLSYHHIIKNMFGVGAIFKHYEKRRVNENQSI